MKETQIISAFFQTVDQWNTECKLNNQHAMKAKLAINVNKRNVLKTLKMECVQYRQNVVKFSINRNRTFCSSFLRINFNKT